MPHSVVHKGRKSVSAAVLGDVVIEEQDNWALRGRWDLRRREWEGISVIGSTLHEGTEVAMRLTCDSEETSLAQIQEIFVEVVDDYYVHLVGTSP